MLKHLCNLNDKNENKQLVDVVKSGLIDLKNEIKKMPENEIKIEKPQKIEETVEKIFKFNQQKQQGKGLEI